MSKPVHMAKYMRFEGKVSALCSRSPRAIRLQRASWTLQPELVTCARCRECIELRRQAVSEFVLAAMISGDRLDAWRTNDRVRRRYGRRPKHASSRRMLEDMCQGDARDAAVMLRAMGVVEVSEGER